jgi:maltose alpha-D-glucosyltransferase/alpha-amylase
MRTSARQVFAMLRRRARDLPQADELLGLEGRILERFRSILDPISADLRIRTHGDYHLGQVLYTGKDFVIIDFEGEPARPISERRIKRSALRDVAGMIRSFHYAAYTSVQRTRDPNAPGGASDGDAAEAWAEYWYRWVSASFLRAYFDTAGGAGFLAHDNHGRQLLLDAYLLDKALYELRYEANNRPDWLHIPARGVLKLLEGER